MKNLLKEIHEQSSIPDEFDSKINQAIYRGSHSKRAVPYKKSLISAAACFALFVILLNTNSAFAESMFDIPILNKLSKVFTFREYEFEDSKKIVNVKIPNISNTGNSALENRINHQIRKIINDEIEASEERALEYYDAFIATGGKKEDFLPMEIIVDYDIKNSNEKYVSFVIEKFESLASAYSEYYYYNIDLESGREFTLKDVLGSDYKNIIYNQIKEQIKTMDEERKTFLFDDISIIDLINANRPFYINEDGSIVIVFEKYEIGAGAAGKYEFVLDVKIE